MVDEVVDEPRLPENPGAPFRCERRKNTDVLSVSVGDMGGWERTSSRNVLANVCRSHSSLCCHRLKPPPLRNTNETKKQLEWNPKLLVEGTTLTESEGAPRTSQGKDRSWPGTGVALTLSRASKNAGPVSVLVTPRRISVSGPAVRSSACRPEQRRGRAKQQRIRVPDRADRCSFDKIGTLGEGEGASRA